MIRFTNIPLASPALKKIIDGPGFDSFRIRLPGFLRLEAGRSAGLVLLNPHL
ncbi:hypothetical protein [Alkalicoccus saliphilus]|uniref:hypothetical protein n=1 Tax=Alkalicoccus saliphilus TaxID=200989 RepID=UPI001C3FC79A|nr:hypothetical protein [Alkalicoccus saliphilus]